MSLYRAGAGRLDPPAVALGFTASGAALGLFLVPAPLAVSIESTGTPRLALFGFIAFYVTLFIRHLVVPAPGSGGQMRLMRRQPGTECETNHSNGRVR